MKVKIILIVIGALGTVPKGSLKRLEDLEITGRVETVQTTAILRSATTVLETCCHSKSSERPSANIDEKNSQIIHDRIRTLEENKTYIYLGILEADTIKQVQMKDWIRKEYLRRTRKLLSSRNLIKGINTWAVPLVRYSRPFLKWTREELKKMDQRTRKLMIMHKVLHPRDDVVYVSRK